MGSSRGTEWCLIMREEAGRRWRHCWRRKTRRSENEGNAKHLQISSGGSRRDDSVGGTGFIDGCRETRNKGIGIEAGDAVNDAAGAVRNEDGGQSIHTEEFAEAVCKDHRRSELRGGDVRSHACFIFVGINSEESDARLLLVLRIHLS